MSDSRPPDDGGQWPERDLHPSADDPERPAQSGPYRTDADADLPADARAHADVGPDAPWAGPPPTDHPGIERAVPLETGSVATSFDGGMDDWDPRRDGDRRQATTAEQAVPWLIGIILALSGMVIVLLALIFTGPDGLIGGSPSATPAPSPFAAPSAPASVDAEPSLAPNPAPSVIGSPTVAPTAAPTPTPAPTYGPLEMVYLGRQSVTGPIHLLRRDFSVAGNATPMAQPAGGVDRFAWAPDGRYGVALIAGDALAISPDRPARTLAESISAVTFSWDSETVYAARITRSGANDVAEVLSIDFAAGGTRVLAELTYPHPVTAPEPALPEAQFIDDGGLVRLYATNDGNVVLWVLGAPAVYRLDPADGRVTEQDNEPVLWSPDGRQRIALTENSNGTTVITMRDRADEAVAAVQVTGLVSHVRWAPTRNEIVFTLGQRTNAGGVRQNLYVWDLADGNAPAAVTSNGTSFGAEWLGVAQTWQP